MDEKIRTLHELCEIITHELEECVEKLHKDSNLSHSDVEYLDKLTHTLKSIKTTLAMMEAEEEDGYSERWYMPAYGSYRGGMSRRSYEGGASGRRSYEGGMSGRRDYRMADEVERGRSWASASEESVQQLEKIKANADETTRRVIDKAIRELRG